MDYDELIALANELKNTRWPVAYVVSRKARCTLLRHTADPFSEEETFTGPSLMDAPLYDFPDVPDDEGLIFFDRKALHEYMRLREQVGHKAAVMRLTAYIEDGLIQEADIRALIDRS